MTGHWAVSLLKRLLCTCSQPLDLFLHHPIPNCLFNSMIKSDLNSKLSTAFLVFGPCSFLLDNQVLEKIKIQVVVDIKTRRTRMEIHLNSHRSYTWRYSRRSKCRSRSRKGVSPGTEAVPQQKSAKQQGDLDNLQLIIISLILILQPSCSPLG